MPWQKQASVEAPANTAFQNGLRFECHPAQHQCEQHHDKRKVEGRHDNRISAGEGDQKAATAEHQPGLVAVPERRDRRQHAIALGVVLGEREQHADAEVEAVENDVKRHGDGEDAGPDERKLCGEVHGAILSSQTTDARWQAAVGRPHRAAHPAAIERSAD
jgi:hypothetical protein